MFTFEPGYYEWHLKKDGKLYYVFSDDISEEIANIEEENGHDLTQSELRGIVESEVECMELDLDDYDGEYAKIEELNKNWNIDKIFSLPNFAEREEIINAMVNGYAIHFGIK